MDIQKITFIKMAGFISWLPGMSMLFKNNK
jgi:hypothetical protein